MKNQNQKPQAKTHTIWTREKLEKRLEQLPPWDEAAECGAIGAMLINSQAAHIALEELAADDFYHPSNQKLFEVIGDLYEKFETVDELILCGELEQRGLLDTVGGRDAIGRLIYNTPSAAGIEGYCEAILDRSRDRKAIQVAGEMLSGASTLEQTAKSVEALATTKGSIETSDVDELEAEVEAEISGTRRALVPPGWPRLSATQMLLPGKITIICGSPGVSKSFFSIEPIWRWAEAGESVAALELEDGANYHLRRVHAQMSQCADLTRADWCKRNPEKMRESLAEYRDRLIALRSVIQSPLASDRPTVDYLLKWIRARCIEQVRVLLIDPITLMITGENSNRDHERFVTEAKAIINRYGASLILVTHPKRGKPGELMIPCLDNLPNSSAYDRFCHTVLWLERVEEVEEDIEGKAMPVNRYLHPLKVRCGPNPGRLAYYFHGDSLRHYEQGRLDTF